MRPVFPPETLIRAPAPEIEAQANAAAAVKSRAAYLAGLQQDAEFKAHVLDGFLQEQEAHYLALLETCTPDHARDHRAAWKAIKDLRARLQADLHSAALKLTT